jgi:anti-anti-sigma regulatory factor
MSYVNWQVEEDILVGTVSATHIPDDQSAARLTEDLKDGVSAHVMQAGAAATGAETKVLIDCAALQGAPASLASRVQQLFETWHDLNIELKLCDVPYEVLAALETTGTDHLVKIYDNQSNALAAFRGQEVPTITTATAEKPDEKAALESKPDQPREASKVGQAIENLRAVAAIVTDIVVIKSRRQLQNSKVIRTAVSLLAVAAFLTAGTLLWQYMTTSRYKTVPVSGTLRLDGEPLSRISVIFEPIGSEENPYPGPSSYGTTNASGRFSLQTITTNQTGAVVGNHRVRLVSIIDPDDPRFYSFENTNLLPPQYNIETTLTYLVPPEGTQQVLFDVQLEEKAEDEEDEDEEDADEEDEDEEDKDEEEDEEKEDEEEKEQEEEQEEE